MHGNSALISERVSANNTDSILLVLTFSSIVHAHTMFVYN